MKSASKTAPVALVLFFFFIGIVFHAPPLQAQTATPPASSDERAPRNIIILFADGAAATQWDFGRYSSRILRRTPFVTTDEVFRKGALGVLATEPHDSYVTDSAAAATAMSTGKKTKNGAIAITPDGRPVKTLMEAAKAKGKRIGLVTTAAVYDATPAAFSVHAKSRNDTQALVDQYLLLEPDVLLGGGADYFQPLSLDGGKRKDGKNIVDAFRAKGYAVARTPKELQAAAGAKLLGLFSDGELGFEIDRDPAKEPTIAEMAAKAIQVLAKDNPNGFVLLVENENIDSAGHYNDAAALMRALWALDDAVKVALDFQRGTPDTLVIVTGDHETGGFSPTYASKGLGVVTGRLRTYFGEAQLCMLQGFTMSFSAARKKLGDQPSDDALDRLLAQHFPGMTLDADLREAIQKRQRLERNTFYVMENTLGRMVARQTGLYWGTAGHTAEPVLAGAIGPGAKAFAGYQDNSDFARHLFRLLGERLP